MLALETDGDDSLGLRRMEERMANATHNLIVLHKVLEMYLHANF